MSVDLAEFEELTRRTPQRCVIGRVLEQLDGEERSKLSAALEASHISHSAISRWLQKRSLPGGDGAAKKHREGACCCGR